MDTPASSGIVAILHLSDLHLGERFEDVGSREKGTFGSVIRKRRLEMQAHDPYILACLHTELRAAARRLGAPDDRFDFCVLTGDISTNANSGARFEFARQYLTGKIALNERLAIGLDLARSELFSVPGNHDVMFERSPERYLTGFRDFPKAPPYLVCVTARNARQFVLYGIDSNLYAEGNVAVGKIQPETMGWLSEQLDRDVAETPNRAVVRVLLLHHHPCDLNPYRSWSLRGVFWDRFTRLEEGDRLLEICRDRIDVIMHGHEHFSIAFRDRRSGCVVVSAGTTSEWQPKSGDGNRFHALIFDDLILKVIELTWNGARFREDRTWRFLVPSSTKVLSLIEAYEAPPYPKDRWRDREPYDDAVRSGLAVPPTLADAFVCDIWEQIARAQERSEQPPETVSGDDVKKALGMYDEEDWQDLSGDRPWTHWNFVRGLDAEQRDLLAREVAGYIAENARRIKAWLLRL